MKVSHLRRSLLGLGLWLQASLASAQLLQPPFPTSTPTIPPPPRALPNFVPPVPVAPGPPPPFAIQPVVQMPPPAYVPPPGYNLPPHVHQAQGQAPNYGPLTAFTWDAEEKRSKPSVGDLYANFTFWFTNNSPKDVLIHAVSTSCGCTVARLPATPWLVPPGTNGPIEVSLDLRGKMGLISKSVTVSSSAGTKALIIKVELPMAGAPTGFPVAGALPPNHPPMADADRLANMQKSLADRQVVFKDAACAKCHADPALAVADGHALYHGVCAVCHDSPLRAAAVTDLKALKHTTDLDYWKHWIAFGKPGSMMPSFARSAGEGGPLTDEQVTAIAVYCLRVFQLRPDAAPASPAKPTNATASAANVLPPRAN